jgi:hypothetical protein
VVSCVAAQLASRASSGCVDAMLVAVSVLVNDDLNVSCNPGAEGAPRSNSCLWDFVLVLLVLVGWADDGATRRDCHLR